MKKKNQQQKKTTTTLETLRLNELASVSGGIERPKKRAMILNLSLGWEA